MEKGQAVSIVKRLAAYYPNWKVDKSIIEIWVDTLIAEDYENAMQNMKEYISSNEYPPSIAAIIKPNLRIEGKRDIERTRQMLQEQEALRNSIPKELPWVREGLSRDAWMKKIIAEKEGQKWDTSA